MLTPDRVKSIPRRCHRGTSPEGPPDSAVRRPCPGGLPTRCGPPPLPPGSPGEFHPEAAMLPHLVGRPATRKRWPEGVDKTSFFVKDLEAGTPGWLTRVQIRHGSGPKFYPVFDSPAALAWLGQVAALELHVPQWRIEQPAGPTVTSRSAERHPDRGGVRSGPRPRRRAGGMRGCRPGPAGTPRPARSTSHGRHQRQQGPSPVRADGPADQQRGGLGVGQVGRRRTSESPSRAGGLTDGQVTPNPQGPGRLVAEQQVEDHHLAVLAPRPRPAMGGRAPNLGGTDRTRSTSAGLPGSPGPVGRRCRSARRPAPLPPRWRPRPPGTPRPDRPGVPRYG